MLTLDRTWSRRANQALGQNADVPRVLDLSAITPVNVRQASEAFGTALRLNLIRHFRDHPGPRQAAAAALSVNRQVVAYNVQVLIDCGIIVESEDASDGRSATCSVNSDRVDELVNALRAFTLGSAAGN